MTDPHPESADLGFTSAQDLIQELRAQDISSHDLTASFIERISNVDDSEGGLQSILAISVDVFDQAKIQQFSDESDSDTQSGRNVLAGLPVAIKDNIQAIGLPATAGSLALAGRTVTQDAALVSRLRAAGAVVMASTNLSEWANFRSSESTSGWSAVGGLTANPWKYAHSAGGSSSGSGAAVAAGLVPFAVGSETDGSIVCPASLNGCVGIKPTVGVVSTSGVIPISASQDAPGPLARSVADAALLLDVLGGLDTQSWLDDDSTLRIGVVGQWLTSDDATNTLFHDTVSLLARHGITLTDVRVADATDAEGMDETTVLVHEQMEDLSAYLANRPGHGVKSVADVVAFNKEHSDVELAHFGQEFFEQSTASGGRNEVYRAARARNLEWALTKVLGPGLHDVDVLIGATYAPAWLSTLGHGEDHSSSSWITAPSAIAGWPIGCLPMGIVSGLPVGLGVVARAHDENGLVRAMSRIEKILDLGVLRPTFIR